jgi:phosphinothricin acetyltransferase
MQIRDCLADDITAVRAIYAHHVAHGLGTFETEIPTLDEMRARHARVTASGFPYLVGTDEGRIVGYAYASQFRPRAAYRYAVEDSIYVAPDATGRGYGRALLEALIERCAGLGLRQMIAVIGDSANAGSIAVHRACGFTDAGLLKAVGHKFDLWVDVVLMQRPLGAGSGTPPE